MANTIYSNKVIEAKAKDLLSTAVNTRSLMTVDEDLAQEAGMVKTINVYTYAGEAEELAVGVGNTASKRGSITYAGTDYTVKMVQQAFDYYDEDFMKDETIVDNMLKGANQVMVNKLKLRKQLFLRLSQKAEQLAMIPLLMLFLSSTLKTKAKFSLCSLTLGRPHLERILIISLLS